MKGNKNIYKKILREYEQDRDYSLRMFYSRQKEIYASIPRISEIDNALNLVSVKITKSLLHTPGDYEKLIEELQKETALLQNEKAELLKKYGYPAEYITIQNKCKRCQDTGYVESEKCICFKQKLIEKSYDVSSLKDVLLYENFDNFNISYYSDQPYKNEAVPPRTNINKIYNRCFRFCQMFDKEYINLFFYGDSGLGKTFLCHCIAKNILDKGKAVLYCTSFQLFKTIEEIKFNKIEEEEPSEYLDTILSCDLLIIDDLGTEFSTILASSELFNIINCRLLDKRHTIISTNLSPADLINHYSDRIVSRIQGNYIGLKFYGEDIRVKKKYKNFL